MQLRIVNTYSEEFSKYESDYRQFLQQIESTTNARPADANMGENQNGGFLHIVKGNKRWTKETGQISLLYDNSSIVGISAAEHSSLSATIGSGGNRCWILPQYRQPHTASKYLLTSNLQWCRDNNKAGMLVTFNEYNSTLFDAISKYSITKRTALSDILSPWWIDCIPLPRKIYLFNTPQWAVLKPLLPLNEVSYLIDEIDKIHGIGTS